MSKSKRKWQADFLRDDHQVPISSTLPIFPYYISCVIREQVIWVLAIAHGHSRPEYWTDRPKVID
jgi:hypothetical protein